MINMHHIYGVLGFWGPTPAPSASPRGGVAPGRLCISRRDSRARRARGWTGGREGERERGSECERERGGREREAFPSESPSISAPALPGPRARPRAMRGTVRDRR